MEEKEVSGSGLVSVIMPAYNSERYIESAVQSVLAQTYSHWELLIINDASLDSTLEIANKLKIQDSRIRVLNQTQNSGVSQTRNFGLEQAVGDFIAFLDSDDLWMPNKLERQLKWMKENDLLVCCADYQRIDENGAKLGSVRPPSKVTYNQLLKSNFIGNLTGIYDSRALGKQLFSEFRHEDYVAWLSLVKRAGYAGAVPEELGCYRVYSGTVSSNKVKAASWQWAIYRESESLGFLESCWLMVCYTYYAFAKRV